MHAVCLDTFPPVSYLTDTSHAIIRLVHAINKHFDEYRVSFRSSFDHSVKYLLILFYFTCVNDLCLQHRHFCILQVAYTFDAGPNACLYLLEEHVEMVLSLLCHFFPPTSTDIGQDFVTGIASKIITPSDVSTFTANSQELIKFCAVSHFSVRELFKECFVHCTIYFTFTLCAFLDCT